ncbi:lysosomal protective protein-like [Hemicordylus capensis]|uniref:lysosomal protective protein-like n=1 Tax=Hemicordylus capensis TaxID=884348 RepID=UPI002302C171|nr:lysosomal protective protein-like [Hemicordylus capensis]
MRPSLLRLLVLLAAAAAEVGAAPTGDLIHALPGLATQPPFKQYSGYLEVDGDKKHIHYWFVEAEDTAGNKPPLVLWLNGGPGCSSMASLLTGNGPFRVQPDGTTLTCNKHSWNKLAHMLYLESPVWVGYSTSDNKKDIKTNDTEVARVNHLALKKFIELFPEYQTNDLYLGGESYAGIYVPTLAEKVMEDSSLHLKGIIVGNGDTSHETDINSRVYFAYYHGLLGSRLWSDLQKYCCCCGKCNFYNNRNANCITAVENAYFIVNELGLNVYNIYASCDGGVPGSYKYESGELVSYDEFIRRPLRNSGKQTLPEPLPAEPSEELKISCLSITALSTYMNSNLVRKALHIVESAPAWKICNFELFGNYTKLYPTVKDQYMKLLLSANRYRILVYNGDVDIVCNFLGNKWFVDCLGQQEKGPQRPWTYIEENGQKQIGGFVQEFTTNIAFLTVKGAGHMAAADKPCATYNMFERFIHQKPF